MKELIAVDTNIIVNTLKSQTEGVKSRQLMRDILSGKYTMCVSPYILSEYEEVLRRKELGIQKENSDWIISWIRINAFSVEPKESTSDTVEMRDEKDRPFFDLAKCLGAKLITRNYKDFPVHELVTLIDELY